MANEIKTVTIDPNWFKGSCPGCGRTIYIDETNKRTMHKAPLCKWYTDFVKGARNEGAVELVKKTG